MNNILHGERSMSKLAALDGTSIKDSRSIPHPVDLARWSDQGLYTIDCVPSVFRLTDKGRALSRADK